MDEHKEKKHSDRWIDVQINKPTNKQRDREKQKVKGRLTETEMVRQRIKERTEDR